MLLGAGKVLVGVAGRECEEAVRRYSHLREFMFQGVKVNFMLTDSCHIDGASRKIDFPHREAKLPLPKLHPIVFV